MPALYLTEQGSLLRCEQERLVVERGGRSVFGVPLLQVERVLVFGNVQLTTPAIGLLLHAGVEVSFLSARGRFKGRLVLAACKNIALRRAQYEKAGDSQFAVELARVIVAGKIRNGRAVLGRYGRNHPTSKSGKGQPPSAKQVPLHTIRRDLWHLAQAALRQGKLPSLLGVAGQAAAVYFRGFAAMLRQPETAFMGRTRHPPRDPVNALLSLGYTLAGNELHSVATALGLDPWLGFLHGISERRPGLPMDLLEEFRAPLVDRFTVALLNRQVLDAADFVAHPQGGVTLTSASLKRYLRAWEKNLNRKFKHPVTEQQVSFRRLFALQAGALARAIEHGEPYQPFAFDKM